MCCVYYGDKTMKLTLADAIRALRPNSGYVLRGDTYSGLEWDSTDSLPTEDEVNAKLAELEAAEPHRLLREERDRRLTACDWVVAKHTEHGKMVPEDWKIYRQALRDLPSISYRPELDESGDLKMNSVAWPTPPE
tara:strand:- start:471 stop:875 length:405 start_codon:yes stop_codon:yes gene_type:complete